MSTDLEKGFALLVAAAVAGERCPQNQPFGPLQSGVVEHLVKDGRIRSEVYERNYRRVVILTGKHAGRATAGHPKAGLKPWKINGRHVSASGPPQGISAPVTLPTMSFGRSGS